MGILTGSRRRRVRRAAIMSGSALFHVGLFFVAFSRAAGDLVSAGDTGGGPVGPVYAVSLVRLPAAVDGPESRSVSDPRPFLMKLRQTQAREGIPVPVGAQPDPFAALAERLTVHDERATSPRRRLPADRLQAQGSPVPDETGVSDSRSRFGESENARDGTMAGSTSTGALWGVIEPCWRNLGFRGQVPVVIEVTVNGRGALGRPPSVVRSPTALLSEARLKSEANALAALAACLPRGEVRIAAASYRLEFPATP